MIKPLAQHFEHILQQHLTNSQPWPSSVCEHTQLKDAIIYSVTNGGKRIRPILVYCVGLACSLDIEQLNDLALAVEYIHCYSLIHDDLPAMDNDDLRRGKPSCHKQFDEATAILAGDALHIMAFSALADSPFSAELCLKNIKLLSQACGPSGMVGGQALDIAMENQTADLKLLKNVHALKTGALISACCQMAATFAQADSNSFKAIGDKLGLAFQIQDDVLEATSTTEALGKSARSDEANHKSTFPSLMGLIEAKQLEQRLYQDALALIKPLPHAEHLTELVIQLQARQY